MIGPLTHGQLTKTDSCECQMTHRATPLMASKDKYTMLYNKIGFIINVVTSTMHSAHYDSEIFIAEDTE